MEQYVIQLWKRLMYVWLRLYRKFSPHCTTLLERVRLHVLPPLITASRVLVRLFLLAVWITLCTAAMLLAYPFSSRGFREEGVQYFFCGFCAILGIRYKSEGIISARPATIFVANHCSYTDIVILGALARGSFVAKEEVRYWPVIGQLCGLAGTVFVKRTPGSTHAGLEKMRRVLKQGRNIILFPEGTTSNGREVLPFKSPFFELAREKHGDIQPYVQPVAVVYETIDGQHLDQRADDIAWYGDMRFLPHVLKLLTLKEVQAKVRFLPLLDENPVQGRKAMARISGDLVSQTFREKVHGGLSPEGEAV